MCNSGVYNRRSVLAGLAAAAVMPKIPAEARTRSSAVSLMGGAPSTGWTGFQFPRESLIIMAGTCNGRPARILIDSGVSAVILNEDYARSIGIRRTGDASIGAIAGRTTGSAYEGVTVEIGGVRITSRLAIGVDVSPVQRASGQMVDVLLGRDLLDAVQVDIDFPSRKIAFHDSASYGAPQGAVPVTARLLPNGLRTLPITVQGLPPVAATFDLGARSPLLMSPRYAEQHGLLQGRRVSSSRSVGVAGASIAKLFSADTVSFAGTELSGVPVVVPPTWRNDERNIDSPVYVGLGLLGRFRIVTNYPANKIWFVPSPHGMSAPFRKDRSGLQLELEAGVLRIVHVAVASPAEIAGFAVDENVTAINGRPVTSEYYDTDLYGWQYEAANREVVLRVSSGAERRLILQDYY